MEPERKMRTGSIFPQWFGVSIRRRLLDRTLTSLAGRMQGYVIEVGNGRSGRRGYFRPPTDGIRQWLFVDLSAATQPHVRADVQTLPLKTAVADTALCLETLEYVRHPEEALRELRRVLKSHGTLILATPFLHRVDAAQDYWRFTEPALRTLLADAGFQVEAVHAQGAALAVIANILKHAVAAIPQAWMRQPAAWLAVLPLWCLQRLDQPFARRLPSLRTFSTGYVVIARTHA